MHAPINGSIINPPAKLYKRFTTSQTAKPSADEMSYGSDMYRSYCKIRYVENKDRAEELKQAESGLFTNDNNMIIKLNGNLYPVVGGLDDPEIMDIVEIRNEFWIIENIKRKRLMSLYNVGVIYLGLKKVSTQKK